jgi:phosphatidyl-myo-inositol alpha-mannosyltransferase
MSASVPRPRRAPRAPAPGSERQGDDDRAASARSRRRVSLLIALAALVGLGLAGAAISRLGVHTVVSSLTGVAPGWLVVACALMMLSLLLRSVAWWVVLRAALPGVRVPAPVVARATMIGVMVSAVLPGRLGEPARAMIVARRVGGLATVAGTILSQTLLNLVALVTLSGAVIASTHVLSGPTGALLGLSVPVALVALVLVAPGALRRAPRRGPLWLRRATERLASEAEHVRAGLRVFRHRRAGVAATLAQVAAWAVQVLSAYAVLEALGLAHTVGLAGAAAILVAVNVTAVVPVTPSNVGVFQAACIAVLAAFGVSAGDGLAYGIVLQAVEVATAIVFGVPALVREGVAWSDLRRGAPAAFSGPSDAGSPASGRPCAQPCPPAGSVLPQSHSQRSRSSSSSP